MKTAFTIAPPPPARRHRPLQLEPLVFAVLLMALTLGINVVLPKAGADHATDTSQKSQPTQPVAAAEVARIAQVN